MPGLTSVKSISQCCPGFSPRYLIPVCCPFPSFIIWHALQAWIMSRTVACCRGNQKRAVCKRVRVFFFFPRWVVRCRSEVLTQVGGKYQVVILVLIPSVFALLRAGIFLNPIEIRRGILGGWGQGSHTWGWQPHS